jgi:RNA polymerase sigma factor (sigma-70 family)
MARMPDVPAAQRGDGADGQKSPGASKTSGLGRWAQEYAEDLQRFLSKRRIIDSDIKDVCQEVYLRLLRFNRAEVITNPQAYLFRVAANVAHDFKLRQQRWEPLENSAIDTEPSSGGPEQIAEDGARSALVLGALSQLPPLVRAALALQNQEDLTYDQIAMRLGVSRRTVKRAVARGYALMREALNDVR